ncbi:unnamed protein product [Brassica rapa subsp. trilocularis]
MILEVLCHCDIIVNQKMMSLETELWHQEDRGSLNLNLVFSVILNSIAVSAGKTSCIIWIFTNRIETDCLQSLGVEDSRCEWKIHKNGACKLNKESKTM